MLVVLSLSSLKLFVLRALVKLLAVVVLALCSVEVRKLLIVVGLFGWLYGVSFPVTGAVGALLPAAELTDGQPTDEGNGETGDFGLALPDFVLTPCDVDGRISSLEGAFRRKPKVGIGYDCGARECRVRCAPYENPCCGSQIREDW